MATRAASFVFLTVILADFAVGYRHDSRQTRGLSSMQKRSVNGGSVVCDASYSYRSYDGACNNLVHTNYGRAGAKFRRELPPKYHGGDKTTPRMSGSNGKPLPSARKVSAIIHDPENHTMGATMMFMQWGQFLDHDMTHTPVVNESLRCCSNSLVTGNNLHHDVRTGGPCFPIIIPSGDSHFNTVQDRCMEFVRSDSVTGANGVRQQYNGNTAWIDGSHIYGISADQASTLRSHQGGKLRVRRRNGMDYLPEDVGKGDETCFKIKEGDYCFLAGDHRVNVFPGLSALHTVFLRYHNKLCDRIKAKHPSWGDEKLYQESRRIVIAVIQGITYREFVPQIVGDSLARTHGLNPHGVTFKYNSSIDPTLTNVFATAAYRFGHSLVSDSLTIAGREVEIGDLYMRPKFVLNSLRPLVEALIAEPAQRVDRWYTTGLTNRLFEMPNKPKSGFDLAARNIQRGRDHGLAPYNVWREHYGLSRITSFNQLPQRSFQRFSRVYASVDDIDLYTGGLTELPAGGRGRVGELFSRIMAQQFSALKFGDRFWYENKQSTGAATFTERQIRQLSRIPLSRVLCDTIPGLDKVQAATMRATDSTNSKVTCSSLFDLDIEHFW
ncbi:chorion peroxidase [Plakobranchus ocellatus]|uniref:Chorion peroxidase n=1 Tax=Plakobranchus ocellatus TaxID=259542 RepID=A0AAV3ZTP1_9GAST|nr:chorion peroxidase [Plakobranchus ocellatus]